MKERNQSKKGELKMESMKLNVDEKENATVIEEKYCVCKAEVEVKNYDLDKAKDGGAFYPWVDSKTRNAVNEDSYFKYVSVHPTKEEALEALEKCVPYDRPMGSYHLIGQYAVYPMYFEPIGEEWLADFSDGQIATKSC